MRLMKQKLLNGVRFCTKCGARMLFQGYDTQFRLAHIMQRRQICYDCAYWEDLKEFPLENMEVIGNKCYRIGPVADRKDKSLILGGKGKMHYFMRPDWSVFRSNDIWLIGTIPERFRSEFAQTAVEVTIRVYRQLNRNNKKCKARGCLDRYHCLRYNIELEKNGPFNTVPATWNVGDEHCGFFINKDDVLSDESSI